jgi:hypothetical protein
VDCLGPALASDRCAHGIHRRGLAIRIADRGQTLERTEVDRNCPQLCAFDATSASAGHCPAFALKAGALCCGLSCSDGGITVCMRAFFAAAFTISISALAPAMVGGAPEIPEAQSQPEVFVGSGGNFCTGTRPCAHRALYSWGRQLQARRGRPRPPTGVQGRGGDRHPPAVQSQERWTGFLSIASRNEHAQRLPQSECAFDFLIKFKRPSARTSVSAERGCGNDPTHVAGPVR